MKSMTRPSYEQVSALCSVIEDRVAPSSTDGNGHMNVRHIYACGVEGADLLAERVGINDRYRADRRTGIFAAEHHIRFFAELHEDDCFSVHPLWIDRAEKVGHLLVFVLNRTTHELSASLELLVVNVDLDSRSAVAFPADVGAEIDRQIAAAEALPWTPPIGGAMGVRR
jgi:acyl-CoA thioester hydrolase